MNPAWLIAALGSVLYGAADFFGGLAAKRASAVAVTFFSGFAGLAVLLIGLPFTPGAPHTSDLLWGLAAGASGALGATLIYRALAIGPMSVASPVLCIVALCLPVVVGFALGERPLPIALVGIALAPIAVALLAQSGSNEDEPGRAAGRRVLGPAILAGLAAGLFLVFMGRVQAGAGLLPLIVSRLTAITVLGVLLAIRRQPAIPTTGVRTITLFTGALDSLGTIAYVAAVQRGSLAVVSVLVSLAPATSVLLARAVLAERWSVPQRWGLVLALGAGACLSLG